MDNQILFDNYTYEDLLREIHTNTSKKRQQIFDTFEGLKPLITTLNDAVILMPTMVQLQESSIRNDEHLLKMAAIVTKTKKNQPIQMDQLLSEDEKRKLLEEAHKTYRRGEPGPSN